MLAPYRVMSVILPGSRDGFNVRRSSRQVRGRRRRTNLDADGVCDAAEELDMRVVDLPRAITNPEEVRRGVVVLLLALLGFPRQAQLQCGLLLWILHQAGQGLLVFQEEALMAGEQVDSVEACRSYRHQWCA